MLKSILLFCTVLSFNTSNGQNSILKTGSDITIKDANELLAHHNKVRKDVGVTPLVWSSKLAAYAQEWANHLANENNCNMAHRTTPGQEEGAYGENIFWGSSAKDFKPLNASEDWYSEIKLFKYKELTDKNWYASGHYTQMVWKNTQAIGVGVSTCPTGAIIIVANYFPAGNFMHQLPY
jgi:uncharacterized protein YkwD